MLASSTPAYPCAGGPPIPAQVVLAALEQRNKERILAGLPTYPSIEGMVESYMEFEGAEKGMSLLEAEDEVVRYLQRKAARRVDLGHLRATRQAPLGGGEGPRGYSLLAALRSRGEPPSASAPTGEAAVRPPAPSAACGRRLWPSLWHHCGASDPARPYS